MAKKRRQPQVKMFLKMEFEGSRGKLASASWDSEEEFVRIKGELSRWGLEKFCEAVQSLSRGKAAAITTATCTIGGHEAKP